MDYKYIECLIERYFNCETTLQEEQILRDFFTQEELPEHLLSYKPMFEAIEADAELELPAEFDEQLLSRIESLEKTAPSKKSFKTRFINFNHSMSPFYKAVASVALIITVGVTSSRYWISQDPDPIEYNYSGYHETYSDPDMACEQLNTALKDLGDALRQQGLEANDSLCLDSIKVDSMSVGKNITD